MILAIFLLAAILLIAGGMGLVSAIGLVPTDLGFTYFQSGTIALSAGSIVLALGFAAASLDRGLRRLAAPAAIRVAAPQPASEAPAFEAPAGEDRPTVSPTGAILAGAATGALATASLSAETDARQAAAEAPALSAPEKLLEDFERDLFTGIEARPVPPLESPQPAADVSIGLGANGLAPAFPVPEGVEDGVALEPLPAGPPLEAVEDTAPGVTGNGVEAGRRSEPRPFWDPEPAEPLPVAQEPEQEPEREPAAMAVAAPDEPWPAPVPGLIDDADLAAVSDGQLPPLAPISGLEIVGSYDSAGTRFTMYSDGSVIAAGPQGDRRFRSLDELRQHLDAGPG